MKKFIFALVFLTCSAHASFRIDFDAEQLDNLGYAYMYGKQYDLKGNFRDVNSPEFIHQKDLGHVLAAIAWQESSAGKDTGRNRAGHHAYGLFQNYIFTVKKKMRQRDIPINKYKLRVDLEKRKVSADWAVDELSYWLKHRNGNLRKALASYYAGWNYRNGLWYADMVLAKKRYLERQSFLK